MNKSLNLYLDFLNQKCKKKQSLANKNRLNFENTKDKIKVLEKSINETENSKNKDLNNPNYYINSANFKNEIFIKINNFKDILNIQKLEFINAEKEVKEYNKYFTCIENYANKKLKEKKQKINLQNQKNIEELSLRKNNLLVY